MISIEHRTSKFMINVEKLIFDFQQITQAPVLRKKNQNYTRWVLLMQRTAKKWFFPDSLKRMDYFHFFHSAIMQTGLLDIKDKYYLATSEPDLARYLFFQIYGISDNWLPYGLFMSRLSWSGMFLYFGRRMWINFFRGPS